MTRQLEVEIVEPVREVVEVVEQGERIFYVVEPTVGQAVPSELADLDDVAETAPSTGQALVWTGTVWAPATVTGDGAVVDLSELEGRVGVLEARPVVDSPDDIGAQPAGSYATTVQLTSGLAGKANSSHGHAIGDVTDLQAVLDGKQPAGSYATVTLLNQGLAARAMVNHTHLLGDIDDLDVALDEKADAAAVATALAGKEDAGVAASAVAVHTAAADPHGQYLTNGRGDARYQPIGSYATTDDLDDYVTLTEFGTVTTSLAGKQAADADLTTIAALAPADGSVLARVAGAWSSRTGAQLKADLGLGNVDNTSDLDKPISTATQTALDGKAATGHTHTPPARVVSTPVALVDAATITTDAALGNTFRVTLAGNRALAAPTNPADGQRVLWEFVQDATGGRTITLATGAGGFQVGADGAVVLSTAAGTLDAMGAEYHAGRDRWLVLALAKGF